MIKPKAPRDMDASEFVAEVKIRVERGCFPYPLSYNDLCGMLDEPAPSLFTSDQLAWMRVERVYRKINYAACEVGGTIVFFEDKPNKSSAAKGRWASRLGYREIVGASYTFLAEVLSPDDEEPFCFADYAPLEEAACDDGRADNGKTSEPSPMQSVATPSIPKKDDKDRFFERY